MKKLIFLSTVLLLTCSLGYSQAFQNLRSDGMSAANNEFFTKIRKVKDVETGVLETVGTPYIDESFQPSEIYYDAELVGKFFYRHNGYNDQIEIKDTQLDEEEPASLATLRQLRIIDKTTGQELSMIAYKNKEEQVRNGYMYKLLEVDEYSLFYKKNVKFTQGTLPVNSLVRPTPNKFSKFIEYYFIEKDSKVAVYIPTNKNKFIRSFNKDIQPDLKDFIKSESINLKKEEDLIRVFEFINKSV